MNLAGRANRVHAELPKPHFLLTTKPAEMLSFYPGVNRKGRKLPNLGLRRPEKPTRATKTLVRTLSFKPDRLTCYQHQIGFSICDEAALIGVVRMLVKFALVGSSPPDDGPGPRVDLTCSRSSALTSAMSSTVRSSWLTTNPIFTIPLAAASLYGQHQFIMS
jgi:hypothetical protein